MGKNKTELLSTTVRHPDINHVDFVSLISQMQNTVFQARNNAHTPHYYEQILTIKVVECSSLVGSTHLDATHTY